MEDLIVVPLGLNGFRIVNVADPSNPFELYSDTTLCGIGILVFPYLFACGDGHVELTGKDLSIFDIRDPENPVLVDRKTMYQPVYDMEVHNGYLFTAETESMNIYKLNLNWDGIDDPPAVAISRSFRILPAYPNPFNPTTTFALSLPQPGLLTVNVYNLLGQSVMNLYRDHADAGSIRFQFDGTNLSSGMYLIRATLPGYVDQVKRITLIK